jgi:hypothetical protein
MFDMGSTCGNTLRRITMDRYLDLLEHALAKHEAERTPAGIRAQPFMLAQRELLAKPPPADVMSEELCPVCGSLDRWQWLDGQLLCRICLIFDLVPMTLLRQGWHQDPKATPAHG